VLGGEQAPLVVHIIYALKSGGLENGLVNIINRTPRQRYRHAIICLTEADEFANRITTPNVEIIQLHKKPGNDWGLYWRVWNALRKLKPAIVHTRNFNSLEMQFFAFGLWGVKRVHGEHGRDLNDLDGSNKKYNIFRKVMRIFVQQYIAVSKDLEAWLRNVVHVPRDRITQIYNGVDLARFERKKEIVDQPLPDSFSNQEFIVIGTVGRLAGVKNQLSLVRAFSLSVESNSHLKDKLKLVIVGGGPMKGQLQQEIENLSRSDSVWLAGERSDIPDLMAQMDVFVLPSLGEGISNTILEAMAAGLPIIATRVGGSPELVSDGKNGLLVPVDDDRALADAITALADNKNTREKMGAMSHQKITESFNWQKTVEQYLSIYDKLLGCNK